MLKLDLSGVYPFVAESEIAGAAPALGRAHEMLETKTGKGAAFTGWLTLPADYDREEHARIKSAAGRLDGACLVVVGIGGSYLGARAAIELLRPDCDNVLFAGNGLSTDSLSRIIRRLEGRDFYINAVSKSGTTLEPAVTLRILRQLLETRYGKAEANRRILATTGSKGGALRKMAEENGWESFSIPEDIGGRYSVLTAAGLLPLAAAGVDTGAVLRAAASEMEDLREKSMSNPAWGYAAARNLLYGRGFRLELLATWEPRFRWMGEWFKQLFGESEGKERRGLFPAYAEFSADLHSLGQYIQEGSRILFETVLDFKSSCPDICIPSDERCPDGLGCLGLKRLQYVQEQAMRGVRQAHVDGGVPYIGIGAPEIGDECFGRLAYFFELSCALSGYLLDVNPFDQPGVEAYKKNVHRLIGKV